MIDAHNYNNSESWNEIFNDSYLECSFASFQVETL